MNTVANSWPKSKPLAARAGNFLGQSDKLTLHADATANPELVDSEPIPGNPESFSPIPLQMNSLGAGQVSLQMHPVEQAGSMRPSNDAASIPQMNPIAAFAQPEIPDRGRSETGKPAQTLSETEAKPASPPPSDSEAALPEPEEKSKKDPKALMKEDAEFQSLLKKSKSEAKKQKTYKRPVGQKVAEASAAVSLQDDNAVDAGLTVLNVSENLDKKKADSFDSQKFKSELKQKINGAVPIEPNEAKAFIKNPDKLNGIANTTRTDINKAQKSYTEEAGKISSTDVARNADRKEVPVAPGIKYKPEALGEKAQIPQPERAVPKPLPEEEFKMDEDHDADSLDREMEANKMTETQLAESEEPSFIDTLTEKKTSQEELRKIPQQLKDTEVNQRETSVRKSKGTIASGIKDFYDARTESSGGIGEKQNDLTTGKTSHLEAYYAQIQTIYEDTKNLVIPHLKSLENYVTTTFSLFVDLAFSLFKSNVSSRLEDYYDWKIVRKDYEKEDKMIRAFHNNAIDKEIKSLTQKRDQLDRSSPEWAQTQQKIEQLQNRRVKLKIEKIFEEEKKLFTDNLDRAIDLIAEAISKGLNLAKTWIDQGETRVLEAYNKLDKADQEQAKTSTDGVLSLFSSLENQVTDHANELQNTLAKQYTESVAKLEQTFEDIRKEAALSWWERAWRKIKEIATIIFDIGKLLLNILVKAANVIGDIVLHPIRFFGNLIDGVSLGFGNFMDRLPEHLENVMFKLVLGVIPPGVSLPDSWTPQSIFKFVLDFLGLSKENLRKQAVDFFGEPVVEQLEKGFELFIIFKNEGFAGLWSHLQTKIGDLKSAIIEEVKTYFQESIIKAAIEFLLSALTPVSGFIKVCKSIINIVKFFIKNLVNILKLLDSILDSFADLAAGKIENAAARIESALADILLIGIKFLAALVGINLDKIQAKITKIIDSVRIPINNAIQWFFEKAKLFAEKTGLIDLATKGREMYNSSKDWVKEKAEAGKQKVGKAANKVLGWLGLRKKFTLANGEEHEAYFENKTPQASLIISSTDPKTITQIIIAKSWNGKAIPPDKITDLQTSASIIDANREAQGVEKGKIIKTEFDKIVAILNAIGGPPIPKTTLVRNEKVTGAGMEMGKHLIASPLSLDPGGLVGSQPTYTTGLGALLKLNYPDFIVEGHLLNHKLHGPGNVSWNLTPIAKKTNSDMNSKFEHFAKDHIIGKGKVVKYEVEVEYGKNLDAGIYSDPDAYVAENLNFSLTELEYQNNKWEPAITQPSNWNIPASIPHAKTSIPGFGTGKLNFMVNLNTSDARAIERIKGVGPKRAQGIVEYRKNKMKDKGTQIDSYAELETAPGIGPQTVELLRAEPMVRIRG